MVVVAATENTLHPHAKMLALAQKAGEVDEFAWRGFMNTSPVT
jgi:hypothetical protein